MTSVSSVLLRDQLLSSHGLKFSVTATDFCHEDLKMVILGGEKKGGGWGESIAPNQVCHHQPDNKITPCFGGNIKTSFLHRYFSAMILRA